MSSLLILCTFHRKLCMCKFMAVSLRKGTSASSATATQHLVRHSCKLDSSILRLTGRFNAYRLRCAAGASAPLCLLGRSCLSGFAGHLPTKQCEHNFILEQFSLHAV